MSPDGLGKIRACPGLLQRLKSLKEVNLELLTVDCRTVVTHNPEAMVRLMGEKCETSTAEFDRY